MSTWRGTAVALVRACHPAPALLVTVLATAWAVGIGSSGGTIVLVSLAVLTGQLSVGWSNDWLDAGRDAVTGRADKPTVTGAVTAGLLRRCALVAVVLCVGLSLATGWVAGLVHLVTVACGWAYNAGVKSTAWSWLPYALAFGVLPLFVVLAGFPHAAVPVWLMVATALLGVGAHVANTLPDLGDDRRTGVHGLPHRLGRRASSVLAPLVLMLAVLVVAVGPGAFGGPGGVGSPGSTGGPGGLGSPGGPVRWVAVLAAVGVAAAAGIVGWRRPHSRTPFTLSMAVAAICVLLLVQAGAGTMDGS
ncbi:MAG TPA: UbiA family prenyltransferase [Ruania sp.]|nr:UbiA family prenyltransferase [Ruania sp.]